jgi:hypothetical protein
MPDDAPSRKRQIARRSEILTAAHS